MSTDVVLIDDPAPAVRRITLNRPEKRNALTHDNHFEQAGFRILL